MSRSQAMVTGGVLLSAVLALLPPGVGGLPRVVLGGLLVLCGPGVGAMLLSQRHARQPSACPPLPLEIGLLLCLAGSLAAVVLLNTALLVLGVWSVPSVVLAVTVLTLGLTLWPVPPGDRWSRNV